jgi:hypothetical protein
MAVGDPTGRGKGPKTPGEKDIARRYQRLKAKLQPKMIGGTETGMGKTRTMAPGPKGGYVPRGTYRQAISDVARGKYDVKVPPPRARSLRRAYGSVRPMLKEASLAASPKQWWRGVPHVARQVGRTVVGGAATGIAGGLAYEGMRRVVGGAVGTTRQSIHDVLATTKKRQRGEQYKTERVRVTPE